MNTELTEEEMRRALFGDSEPPVPTINVLVQHTVPAVVVVQPVAVERKRKSQKDSHPG